MKLKITAVIAISMLLCVPAYAEDTISAGFVAVYPFEISYGVLDGLKYSGGKYYAVITDENGKRETEIRDSATAGNMSAMLYGAREKDNAIATDGRMSDIVYRVIYYAYDKEGRISFIKNIQGWSISGNISNYLHESIYKNNKLGRNEVGPNRREYFIDVRNHDEDGTYRIINYDELVDGETYRYGHLNNYLFLY